MELYDTRSPGPHRPLDHVEFGHGLDADIDRQLLGDLSGRRVLELGCGGGHGAVGMALRGARVTAVDADVRQLQAARVLASEHAVTVEFHQARPAELAFLEAEQVDVAVSISALSFVEDLNRVFRQVHRVIGHGGHLIVAVPHPAALCAVTESAAGPPVRWLEGEQVGDRWVHTAESVVAAFGRTNFAVDTLLERGQSTAIPATLIVRGRKLGV